MVHRGYGQAAPAPEPTTTYVSTGTSSTGTDVVFGLIVLGIIGVVGLLVYEGMKTQREIVHEQGVGKALEYDAGMTAIGVLGQAFSKNKRRRARRRRR